TKSALSGPPAMSAQWSLSGGKRTWPERPDSLANVPIRTTGAGRRASVYASPEAVAVDTYCPRATQALKLSDLSRLVGQEHAKVEPGYAGQLASDRLFQ